MDAGSTIASLYATVLVGHAYRGLPADGSTPRCVVWIMRRTHACNGQPVVGSGMVVRCYTRGPSRWLPLPTFQLGCLP